VAGRRRLDAELVRRGLCASRAEAQAAVAAGRVTVGGAPALKPARLVDPGEPVELGGPPPRFVSRGGDKLDAALDEGRENVVLSARVGLFKLLLRGEARCAKGWIHENFVESRSQEID
jgi:ribosomal protein S4